jgi:hypothetical protein
VNPIKNFEIAAEALYNEAPSDRARIFTEKLCATIRDKGPAWITSHATDLHITDAEISDSAICPIEQNRLYYLAQWQLALIS